MIIKQETLEFLQELEKNNNRPWFQENKPRYETAYQNGKEFLESIKNEMNKIDIIDKTKLFRVYRDVRFSKDKTPYNCDLRMSMSRAGVDRRGGYYLRISPAESFVACGFWNPESKDLRLIRDHISAEPQRLRKIIAEPTFVSTFGQLEGDQVKSAPKGFSKDNPAIDLLRFKQLIVSKKYENSEVLKKDFLNQVIQDYKAIRPFFNYMTEILTHDLNGVSLI